jgi:hypothetical protein
MNMKNAAAALLVFGVSLWGADFWQAKPPTDWSDKEVQKMLGNSPWARSSSVSLSGPTPPSVGGPTSGPSTDAGAPPPISENAGGRGGRGGGPRPGADQPSPGPSATIVVRWQSALPVKEALARVKYGSESATSPDARKFVETGENAYVVVISGPLRPFLRGSPEALTKTLLSETSLSTKAKGVLNPSDVRFGTIEKAVELYFYFPRSAAYTAEDKEVEFSTRLGDLPLKFKFRLKDMVLNGKLEL